jgi:hypothetical protein
MPAFEHLLPRHAGLRSTTRLRRLISDGSSASVRDWTILLLAGVAAGCASKFANREFIAAVVSPVFDLKSKIPGHAILGTVFPMAIGLALVPRRGASCVMGAAAFLIAMVLRLVGFSGDGLSLGAMTSLATIGPLLDLTLRKTNSGWKQYLAFAGAGLASNLLAFAVRGGVKVLGLDHSGGRRAGSWFVEAVISYPACGILAGLISGTIWFYARSRREREAEDSP